MKITESQLRKIVREEAYRLSPRRPLREAFSYSSKASLLMDALDLLQEAQVMEQRSAMGSDPELDSIVESLEGLIDATSAMAAEEDVPAEPFTMMRDPRAMRH